jgi:hypothetical protein
MKFGGKVTIFFNCFTGTCCLHLLSYSEDGGSCWYLSTSGMFVTVNIILHTELIAVFVTYCMFFKLLLSYIISAVPHSSLRSSHDCYVGITDSTM